jgi:hypothetical protein
MLPECTFYIQAGYVIGDYTKGNASGLMILNVE